MRLLQDPTAKGVHRANYTTRDGQTNSWALKPESEWVLNEVEAIVSAELWEQCNQIIVKTYRQQIKQPTKRAVHLFSGLLHCDCGQPMYVPTNSPKYVCRSCRSKILANDLEEFFLRRIKTYSVSPQDVAVHLQRADEELVERERLLKLQQGELQKTRQEIERVYRLYQDEQIDSEGFGRYHKPLESRIKELEDSIVKLQSEVDICKVSSLSAQEVASEAQTLYDEWPNLEPQERREIVETITEKIIVSKDGISLKLYYAPPCKEATKGWRKGRDLNPR